MKKILLFIPLFILTLIGGYLYQWHINNLRQEASTNTPGEAVASPNLAIANPSPTPVIETPQPASASSVVSEWSVYQDDQENFSFKYHDSWIVQPQAELFTASGSGMRVISDEYEQTKVENEKLENSATISVVVNLSDYKNIDQEYKNSLSNQIGQKQTTMQVAGERALQYDYDYQDIVATETILIKNGKKYTINYQYSDQATKMKYLKNYQQALRSFTINNPVDKKAD